MSSASKSQESSICFSRLLVNLCVALFMRRNAWNEGKEKERWLCELLREICETFNKVDKLRNGEEEKTAHAIQTAKSSK